jgi:protein-S-isoprenylcysteine O-methyltransferase Ste14
MELLILAWGIYFFLHSFMASEAVKQQTGKITGLSNRAYRIIYNLFNFAALAFLLLYLYRIPSAVFYQTTTFFIAIGTLVSLGGSIIMFLSVKNYDLNAFFGFREETMMPLQIRGLNKYVRHPLYSGTIILALGFCIALPYTKCWLLLALMIIYIFIGMQFEEKKLVRCYGDAYRNYQKKVKSLIPHVL